MKELDSKNLRIMFPRGNEIKVIQDAVKTLLQLTVVKNRSFSENSFYMLYYKHFAAITALLEQPDYGSRLLGFICFGFDNFVDSDDPISGFSSQRAGYYICDRLVVFGSSSLIFNKSLPQLQSHLMDQNQSPNLRGDYYFTILLNSILSQVLGSSLSFLPLFLIPITAFSLSHALPSFPSSFFPFSAFPFFKK